MLICRLHLGFPYKNQCKIPVQNSWMNPPFQPSTQSPRKTQQSGRVKAHRSSRRPAHLVPPRPLAPTANLRVAPRPLIGVELPGGGVHPAPSPAPARTAASGRHVRATTPVGAARDGQGRLASSLLLLALGLLLTLGLLLLGLRLLLLGLGLGLGLLALGLSLWLLGGRLAELGLLNLLLSLLSLLLTLLLFLLGLLTLLLALRSLVLLLLPLRLWSKRVRRPGTSRRRRCKWIR